jgi:hypothetical protein
MTVGGHADNGGGARRSCGVRHLLTGLWFSASGGGGGGVVELGFRVCGGSDSKELR